MNWLQNLKAHFARDLLASVVVFLVALPLCMGIAIASGVPPAKGLITGIIGGVIVGMFSGSPLQVSGPAAGLAVIVFELVRDHGISALGPVLLAAGLLQVLAGVLRLGQWFRAMSPSVIYGMLSGIGVVIAAAQFHVMVDDKPHANGLENLMSIPAAIFQGIFPIDGSKHERAALIGIVTIAVLISWEKLRPKKLRFIPGALLGVLTGTAIAQLMQWPVNYVNVPANLLTSLEWPAFARLGESSLLLSAVAVAFVASAETLLSAAAVDRMQTRVRTDYDRELLAQGIGNSLCGLVGGLPMTGVIVRSSANVQAGAESRMSTILHGAWLLAVVALAPALLRLIPVCSLAGILVYTGYKLADPKSVRRLSQFGLVPVLIYAATVITIVATDLLTGVLVGVGLSLVKLIYQATHLRIRVSSSAEPDWDMELRGIASFVRLPQLAAAFEKLPPNAVVWLDAEHLYYVDHSCMDLLRSWSTRLEENGGRLEAPWRILERRYRIPGARQPVLSAQLRESER